MFPIRILLGMKNVYLVYTSKHMVKVYLNSEIGIIICVINNPYKFEMYTIRKPSDLFSEKCRGFGSTSCLYKINIVTNHNCAS
jgi:hypothetical protein